MELIEPDLLVQKLKGLLKGAKKSVKIASAWMRREALNEVLGEIGNNVKVEVILRTSEIGDLKITDCGVFQILEKLRAAIYLSDRLHSKFVVVDEEVAVVGSANLTALGLNLTNGNLETVLLIDEPNTVKELSNHFERLKKEAFPLKGELLGFAVNPSSVYEFEFVSFKEIKLHSFVAAPTSEGKLLGEVVSVKSFHPKLFNPNGCGFQNGELWEFIANTKNCERWKEALLFSAERSSSPFYSAKVKVLALKTERGWGSNFLPVKAGSPVFEAAEDFVKEFLLQNGEGKRQKLPLEVGSTSGLKKVYVDFGEILRRHLAVLGTTGSGKSYFVKLLLKELSTSPFEGKIHILDPHGEYGEVLKPLYGEQLKEVVLENTLLPLSGDEFENLLKELGFGYYISGSSSVAKKNRDLIHRFFSPSLRGSHLYQKPLEELIKELNLSGNHDRLRELLMELFGEKALKNQPEVLKVLDKNLQKEPKVTVWNFKRVDHTRMQANIAALILKTLLTKARREPTPRLLVVEEAHIFAPEKGYGKVPADRENLSLSLLKRLAAEGRKFNLGLTVISQRAAQVSKYVLSQANSVALFRTLSAPDLEACRSYLPLSEQTIQILPLLSVGEAILSGLFVPTALRVRVKSF